jgi:8-oxo-dGTP pyrophosphatase MutT (NUDIX family)
VIAQRRLSPLIIADDQYNPRISELPQGIHSIHVPPSYMDWSVPWPEYDQLVPVWVPASTIQAYERGLADNPFEMPRQDMIDINGQSVFYDRYGFPLNPNGRMGRCGGMGGLWHWGPQFCGDAGVVRRHPRHGWQALLGLRIDNGRWTFPGGVTDPGEDSIETARRECGEETGYKPRGRPTAVLYRGPGNDFRQGDHAWMEAVFAVWQVSYWASRFLRLRPQPGEISEVRFHTLSHINYQAMNPGHDRYVELLKGRYS